MVLNINQEKVDQLDINNIADLFVQGNKHRLRQFGKFTARLSANVYVFWTVHEHRLYVTFSEEMLHTARVHALSRQQKKCYTIYTLLQCYTTVTLCYTKNTEGEF